MSKVKELMNSSEFDVLGEEKKKVIAEFIDGIGNLSFDDTVDKLIKFYENNNLGKISETEQNAMIMAVLAKMQPNARQKIVTALSLLGN